MLSVTAAEAYILSLIEPFQAQADAEYVRLPDALGRILAQDISADLDFPHFSNSAMDGYALRYEDLSQFEVLVIASKDIPAMSSPNPGSTGTLSPGQCARIFTGGMLPEGADTVVMQEDTEREGDRLRLKVKPELGDYVRLKAAFYQAGATLVTAGTRISPLEIGTLAMARQGVVPVYRQPRVAILSTGSELLDLYNFAPPQPGQITDSNQYVLASLVAQAGAIAIPIGMAPDHPEALATAMASAIAAADITISSGGVSVGDYDYVEDLLAKLGAEIHIRAVAIKPGKPLTVATIKRQNSGLQEHQSAKLYFGVPGNPASAIVTFYRLIRGAIAKLNGARCFEWQPQFITATATEDLHAQGRRETYLWGHLNLHSGSYVFTPTGSQNSGDLVSIAGANGFAVLKINQTYVPAGDAVLVMPIA